MAKVPNTAVDAKSHDPQLEKTRASLLSAVVSMELDDIDRSKEAKLTEITDLCWHNMHTETLFTCKMCQVMRTIDGQNPNMSQQS